MTTKTSQFKTNINGHTFAKTYEQNYEPSETIPDQTMSILEIMRRFASGLPLGGQRIPEYDGEDDLLDGVNPKTLDLSEIHQIRIDFANELKELRQSTKPIAKSKQLSIEDVEAVIEKHYKKSLSEKIENPPTK
jgi:hypothetical protein